MFLFCSGIFGSIAIAVDDVDVDVAVTDLVSELDSGMDVRREMTINIDPK